ncbi:hypothetical protein PR048_005970 [Dryococelus australis]|uniref:Uncharacterized protein n=1 Tax=Dryococelus australis TaxID=614101 RepID=A0ABQ9IAQ7_9NEOP|nr:hypothetical protein PR048_005970 [Dryococelus australis]
MFLLLFIPPSQYLCEYLYDIVEFVQSVDDKSITVNYFKALNPSAVQKIHCQAIKLSEHCSKSHTLGSKLSDLCKSFVLLKDVFFFEKTSAELSQLSKQGQVQLTSMFNLEKSCQLIDSDAGKDFISSLGQLFDPRNLVQSDLGHNFCKLMSKLPLHRELPTSKVVEPRSAFRESICSICKEGKDTDVIVVLLSLKTEFPCFVNAAIKSLWIPVNNVD